MYVHMRMQCKGIIMCAVNNYMQLIRSHFILNHYGKYSSARAENNLICILLRTNEKGFQMTNRPTIVEIYTIRFVE